MAQEDHGAGVVLGLEQAGDELHLVGADHRRGLLQADVPVEPARQDVVVPVPPAARAGPAGQGEEVRPLVLVQHSVEREEVRHVTFLAGPLAALQTADLGGGAADRLGGLLQADAALLAQPPQLGAHHQTQDRRASLGMLDVALYRQGAARFGGHACSPG
ncbi:hypothetical protein GCM10010420_33130 [Streptomyces glaucosporus]|uniref:Uncharacterized protein n=1 Tax=Streptomyces glaucosporus TaxID=284044 RepID=A0ABP5VH96_9ACTN